MALDPLGFLQKGFTTGWSFDTPWSKTPAPPEGYDQEVSGGFKTAFDPQRPDGLQPKLFEEPKQYEEDPRLAESLRMQDELIAQFKDPVAYQRANQQQLDAIANMARSQAVRSGVQGPLRGTMAANAQVGLAKALEQQRLQNLNAALSGRYGLVGKAVDARSQYAMYLDRIRRERAQAEAQKNAQLLGFLGMLAGAGAGGLGGSFVGAPMQGAGIGAGIGRGLGEASSGQLYQVSP